MCLCPNHLQQIYVGSPTTLDHALTIRFGGTLTRKIALADDFTTEAAVATPTALPQSRSVSGDVETMVGRV